MMEITLHIEASALADAINNLASAINAQNAVSVSTPAPAVAPQPAVAQAPMPAQASPATVPLAAPPQYTVEQIMEAGATLMDAGMMDQLTNLLHTFGVQAVMDLKPDQLGAFATALRELGAKI